MRTVALGDVARVNPRGDNVPKDDTVSFVGMAQLDADSASASALDARLFESVSKGYTVFRDQDILAAKITPCWQNSKVGQAKLQTPFGVGSSEFHVIRPNDDVERRYVLHFLRQPSVRAAGELWMTGTGGQKRIPASFIEQLAVPLPPLDEQRRIAAILDRADALRTKQREIVAQLNRLTRSVFRETNRNMPLRRRALCDVAKFVSGSTLAAGETFTGQEDGTLLMKVSDMNAPGNEEGITATSLWTGKSIRDSIAVDTGAVVFPKRGASIATNKKRVTTRRTALDPNLMGVQPLRDVTTSYLYMWFQSFDLTSISSGSTVPQLNKQDLATLTIELPEIAVQRKLEERLDAIRTRRRRATKRAEYTDELFASLQSRAFRGDL